MFGIVSWLSSFALSVIDKIGYAGIFFLSLIESAGIPVPSEIVVPFSGFLSLRGDFVLWKVILVATLANYVGSIILYLIGRSGARWLIERYGKYVLISRRDLEIGDAWFERHGLKVVFWGRLLPIVRTFVSLPAGVAKVNFRNFTVFTLAGALLWNTVLAIVGYKAGENWNILSSYFHKLDYLIITATIILIVFYIYRHTKSKNK